MWSFVLGTVAASIILLECGKVLYTSSVNQKNVPKSSHSRIIVEGLSELEHTLTEQAPYIADDEYQMREANFYSIYYENEQELEKIIKNKSDEDIEKMIEKVIQQFTETPVQYQYDCNSSVCSTGFCDEKESKEEESKEEESKEEESEEEESEEDAAIKHLQSRITSYDESIRMDNLLQWNLEKNFVLRQTQPRLQFIISTLKAIHESVDGKKESFAQFISRLTSTVKNIVDSDIFIFKENTKLGQHDLILTNLHQEFSMFHNHLEIMGGKGAISKKVFKHFKQYSFEFFIKLLASMKFNVDKRIQELDMSVEISMENEESDIITHNEPYCLRIGELRRELVKYFIKFYQNEAVKGKNKNEKNGLGIKEKPKKLNDLTGLIGAGAIEAKMNEERKRKSDSIQSSKSDSSAKVLPSKELVVE